MGSEGLSLFETVETVLASSIGDLDRFREEPKGRLARESLEAVAHPDPRRLPGPERLRQARERFQSLAAGCAGAQVGIREFARDTLTVVDFF